MVSLLMGTGEHLCRTENLLHCLGSVTSYCCTDKKGILSWPNTSPEKIFFLHQAETDHGDVNEVEDDSSKEVVILPETLTANHNVHDPFRVDFDDTNWEEHLTSLRPLGLAGLLNTCSLSNLDSGYSHLYSALQVLILMNLVSEFTLFPQFEASAARGCVCELSRMVGVDEERQLQPIQVQCLEMRCHHLCDNTEIRYALPPERLQRLVHRRTW